MEAKECICACKEWCELRSEGCEMECVVKELTDKDIKERIEEIMKDYKLNPIALAGDFATIEREYWKLWEENMLLKHKYSVLKNVYDSLVINLECRLDSA